MTASPIFLYPFGAYGRFARLPLSGPAFFLGPPALASGRRKLGAEWNSDWLSGWADRVAEELSAGLQDFAYANLAVRGLLLREIVDQQVVPAIAVRPDLVMIAAGGNDLVIHARNPDMLAEELDPVVELLGSNGATLILSCAP